MTELYQELEQRNMDLKDKHDSDIATFGKVLGDKQLRDRIEATERKILKKIDSIENLQAKIDAKFKLSYRDNKVLKDIRSNDPKTNTASENTYRFDHRYSGSARQRRIARRKAEESFEAEGKGNKQENSNHRELIAFYEDLEHLVYNTQFEGDYEDTLYYKIFEDEDDEQMKERGFEGGRGVFYIQEYLEIVKKLAPKLYNKVISKYNKNQILKAINNLDINNNFCEYCGGDIDLDEEDNYYGYFVTGSQSPNSLGRGVSRFNEIAEETQWIYYGYCCAYCEEDYLQVMGTNELDWLVGEEATYYMIPEEDVEKSDEWQESFEAAYTPEQKLDDYTPEQLTTSSAVTGDFFEDSLKYSYGGIQAAEEMPPEETEIVYAEGFPALQNAEAGMVVENIENYYKDKEDKFMTLVVDEATLFRLASDLPIFVESTPSKYAGYTNLKFNYVKNPDLEQKILSYAISLPSDMEQQEEPEYLAGDVRNRLFDVEFDDWAEQEMKTHGKDVSFKEWADEESKSHGDEEFMDWAEHEEESHDERYEADENSVWGVRGARQYWQDKFELQMQDWLEFAWANRDNPEFKTYQGDRFADGKRRNIGSSTGVAKKIRGQRNVINTDELYKAWKGQSPVIQATPQKGCLVSYQEAVPEMHIFLDYMENAGIDIKEAEWRNLSDFEMGDRDRYALGDEIIALSSALKKVGDWDWKNVKKIGKGIKQGKYERIQKHMADIDLKTRRVLWDKHHNDFFDIFTDEQIRGLAIPWVTDEYKAESFDAQTWKIKCEVCGEKPIYDTVDSEDYGKEIQVCEECFNNIFTAESFGAEKINTFSEIENEWKDSPVTIYDEADDEFYGVKEILVQEEDDVLEDGQPYLVLNKDSGDLDSPVVYRDFQTGYDAESFEATQERKPRKMCVNCDRQSLAPSASRLGQNICRTCQRRFGLKSKKAESFDAQDEPRKKCINCNKQKLTPSATSKGYTICGTCTRRYNLGGRKYAEESGEDEYKFVGRIPKSMGIGEKTEILRNNLEYVIKKANRPLYPREVVELYNGERGSGKQSKFKKGGLSTGKISRLIKSEPQKYYVSRSGLIHHVGESSMKDYIRNLPAKYYAEENNRLVNSQENILKYLQNSHEYIRRYTAPWKYTSYGIAKEFGIAPSSMRSILRQMELNDLVKTVSKSVEDSPVPTNRKIKIYYLANEKLMN